MKTETVSRILLTVVVLAILTGVGWWAYNGYPWITVLGVVVGLVAIWWIWFRSRSLKPQ